MKEYARQFTAGSMWKLYKIREWVLYVGRVRGKRDFRLMHFSNYVVDTFAAIRPVEPDSNSEGADSAS